MLFTESLWKTSLPPISTQFECWSVHNFLLTLMPRRWLGNFLKTATYLLQFLQMEHMASGRIRCVWQKNARVFFHLIAQLNFYCRPYAIHQSTSFSAFNCLINDSIYIALQQLIHWVFRYGWFFHTLKTLSEFRTFAGLLVQLLSTFLGLAIPNLRHWHLSPPFWILLSLPALAPWFSLVQVLYSFSIPVSSQTYPLGTPPIKKFNNRVTTFQVPFWTTAFIISFVDQYGIVLDSLTQAHTCDWAISRKSRQPVPSPFISSIIHLTATLAQRALNSVNCVL